MSPNYEMYYGDKDLKIHTSLYEVKQSDSEMMEMTEMHLYHHYGTNPLLEHRNLKLPGTSWYIFQIKNQFARSKL